MEHEFLFLANSFLIFLECELGQVQIAYVKMRPFIKVNV